MRRPLALLLLVAALAVAGALAQTTAHGATSTVVVTATVPSATSLDASLCDSGAGSDGVLAFGTVLPNSQVVSTDCAVTFGSSNDTSMLRLYQSDGTTTAMWQHGPGALAATGVFGTSGKAMPTIAGNQQVFGGAMQRDGKLLAVGTDYAKLVVVRWNSDGTLDTAFDGDSGVGNGVVAITPPDGTSYFGLTTQQDSQGRIVIAVRDWSGASFAAVRLLADGKLDTSFGGDGFVNIDSGAPGYDVEESLTLQADDKPVLSGCASANATVCPGSGNGNRVVTVRLRLDGSVDPTYDGDGVRIDHLGSSWEDAEDVTTDATGRIVIGGTIDDQPFAARYTAAGALDTTFNAPNGFRRVDASAATDAGSSVVVQRTGAIVVAGAGNNDWQLVRLTATGALDTSFGAAGVRAVDFGYSSDGGPESLEQLGDGRLIAAGPVGPWPGTDQGVAILTADGTLDPAFSGDGKDAVSLATGTNTDNVGAVFPFVDGRIAGVGFAQNGATTDPTAFVYEHGAGISDYANTVTDWDTAPTTSMFGVCLKSVTGGTAQWSTTGSCPTTDGTNWQAVPLNAAAPGAKTAYSATSGTIGMTATFTFGLRAANNQAPGTYVAPITFEVVAPNA